MVRNPSGFSYIALLVAIVIIGISMTVAGKYWSQVIAREKEVELLFRGDQYRTAIDRYYHAKAPHVYPQALDDLVKDDRFPQAKRHLRTKFKDPVTGEDFEIIRDQMKGNRIVGVHSKSEREPIKRDGFPEPYTEFKEKKQYKEWTFVYAVPQPGQPGPAQPPKTTP